MWIEIFIYFSFPPGRTSRPARALWIEILWIRGKGYEQEVEAREGLVD